MLSRILLLAAGLLGAAGVAAAAAASHTGDTQILGSLALIALTQAPALMAIGLAATTSPVTRIGGLIIAIGAIVFSADLAARHFTGAAIVPMSAPVGGAAIIVGWLIVAVSALLPQRG